MFHEPVHEPTPVIDDLTVHEHLSVLHFSHERPTGDMSTSTCSSLTSRISPGI